MQVYTHDQLANIFNKQDSSIIEDMVYLENLNELHVYKANELEIKEYIEYWLNHIEVFYKQQPSNMIFVLGLVCAFKSIEFLYRQYPHDKICEYYFTVLRDQLLRDQHLEPVI